MNDRLLLDAFGVSPEVRAVFDALNFEGCQLGRVTRVDRERAAVVTDDFESIARFTSLPAVGDWVAVASRGSDDPPYEIVERLPRSTEIVRLVAVERFNAAEQGKAQVVASNVDIIACVEPLDREVRASRIERELVVAYDALADALVVLSKADVEPNAHEIAAQLSQRVIGVDIVVTSAITGEGIDQLRSIASPNKTVALIGASGAGKSTLINALVGSDVAEVGEVRGSDNRGRHTTVARQLLPMPTGGVLLDTPGLRSVGLWDAEAGLESAFPDIVELAEHCKFRDCRHDQEPGCAVKVAVEEGQLDPKRLEHYQRLADEVAQVDERLQSEAKALKEKQARIDAKALRAHYKNKKG